MHIRIGTRTSLMAMAQTRRIADALRALHSDVTTELVGIISAGDRDQTTPLWQMGAAGVFSRELDERLLAGEIDCAVHSLKDLGTQRPDGIGTAALTRRDDVRDIILFRPDILDRLKAGKAIRIGTSAPRRMTLLPPFLGSVLPLLGERAACVSCVPLRGNAHGRIARLRRPREGDGDLDGVALALGGLERLFGDAEGRAVLEPLLSGLKRMIVPLTVCPAAPGQGVVAVEALTARKDMRDLFQALHHEETAQAVAAEREVLIRHGGGCHQKFGATVISPPQLGQDLLLVRGETKEGVRIDADLWRAPEPLDDAVLFDGTAWREKGFRATPLAHKPPAADAAFIANARALSGPLEVPHIWVSGIASWYKLAARGIWVEGCADGFGFDFIRETVGIPLLGLPPLPEWTVYTHEAAVKDWPEGKIAAAYRIEETGDPSVIEALRHASVAWWGSGSQYEALAAHAGHIRLHACGAGKTAERLKAAGVSPLAVFPDRDSFLKWRHAARPAGEGAEEPEAGGV